MNKLLFTVLLSIIVLSCGKSKTCEEPQLDCRNIRCITHLYFFDFKLYSKSTRQDPVFGSNPLYTTDDIKLFADAARNFSIPLTTDNSGQKFQIINAQGEMYLEIKGTDVYKLSASFMAKDCCSSRIKSLSVDDNLTCSCCADIITISVR